MKNEILKKIKTIIWFTIHPNVIYKSFVFNKLSFMLPDTMLANKLYLKLIYKLRLNKSLSFKNPKTFSEKLQYLKLYDRKEIYKTMTNKYEAKKYVANIIGEKYIIPLLGVWDNADDIDYDALPDKFVLKCTHDSGSYVICQDKDKLDKKETNKHLNKCLKIHYWKKSRETSYKHDKYRIIAEKYIYEDEDTTNQPTYLLLCFNGKVDKIEQDIGVKGSNKYSFFDENKKYIQLPGIEGPKEILTNKIDEIIKLAEILSKDIPHVRIDFLVYKEKIYFSEFTFFYSGGFYPFPDNYNKKAGDLIDLSLIDKKI